MGICPIYSEMKLSEGLRQRDLEQNKAEIDEIPTLPDSRDLTREKKFWANKTTC